MIGGEVKISRLPNARRLNLSSDDVITHHGQLFIYIYIYIFFFSRKVASAT